MLTVFMAWTSEPLSPDAAGPWEEIRVVSADLAFVASGATLSAVYHQLKWSLPEGAALVVAPLAGRPKLKGLPAGTQTWLREHLAP